MLFFIFVHQNLLTKICICSDKASVPVALGHYEDKVQLLTDIANSEQLFGEAIVLKGLNAARQQFQLHGRKNVPRVLLLITNGVNRYVYVHNSREIRRCDFHLWLITNERHILLFAPLMPR